MSRSPTMGWRQFLSAVERKNAASIGGESPRGYNYRIARFVNSQTAKGDAADPWRGPAA